MTKEGKEQAFDLIAKKEVNVRFFRFCLSKRRGRRYYNQSHHDEDQLNEEEWELLKKYL